MASEDWTRTRWRFVALLFRFPSVITKLMDISKFQCPLYRCQRDLKVTQIGKPVQCIGVLRYKTKPYGMPFVSNVEFYINTYV